MRNLAHKTKTRLTLFCGALISVLLNSPTLDANAQGVVIEAERLELAHTSPSAQLTLSFTKARLAPCEPLRDWLWLEAERVVWRRPLMSAPHCAPHCAPQELEQLELYAPRLQLSPLINLPLPSLTLAPNELWRSLTPPQFAWRGGALSAQQGLTLPLPSALGGDRGAWVRPSLGWWRGPLVTLELGGEGELFGAWSAWRGGALSVDLTAQGQAQRGQAQRGQAQRGQAQGGQAQRGQAQGGQAQWGMWAEGELTSEPTLNPSLLPLEAWGRWRLQRGARLDLGGRSRLSRWAQLSAQLSLQQPTPSNTPTTTSLISARLGGLTDHLTLDAAHQHAPNLSAEWGGLRLRGSSERAWVSGPFTLRAQGEGSSRASTSLQATPRAHEALTPQHHLWASLSAHARGVRRVDGQHRQLQVGLSLELSEVWRAPQEEALWGALPPRFARLGLQLKHQWHLKGAELSVGSWVGAWRAGLAHLKRSLSATPHLAGELEAHLIKRRALPLKADLTLGAARLSEPQTSPYTPYLSWSLSAGENLTLAWVGASEGGAPWALWGASALTPITSITPPTPITPSTPTLLPSLKQALTLAFSEPSAPLSASLSLWSKGLALASLDWSSPCGCWGARLEGGAWSEGWSLNSSTPHGSPQAQERRVGLSLRLGP